MAADRSMSPRRRTSHAPTSTPVPVNSQWLNIATVLISVAGGYSAAWLHAKAINRKTNAEAHDLEAQTQDRINKRWSAELARRDKQITKLERRLEAIDSDLQDAHEQNDLLAAQLAEERKANRLLTLALETAQARLTATLAELDNAKKQIAILTEHARRMDVWLVGHFAKNGHAEDPDKPPTLTPFDVPDPEVT